MVVTGLEEDVLALHAVPADERVGKRELERVPHVELARHVRRRMRDHEGLARGIGVGRVEAFSLPGFLPARLDVLRAVTLLHGG